MPWAIYLPINLKLAGRRVVVTGQDDEVWRRLEQFLHTQARFTVFYEGTVSEIPDFVNQDAVSMHLRALQPDDLEGAFLLISTFGKGTRNETLYQWAKTRRVLMYAVDDPDHSDLSLPAVGRKGLITIAVSTHGASPLMAVRLRDRFIHQIGDDEVELVDFLARLRPFVQKALPTFERRRDFYRFLIETGIHRHVLSEKHRDDASIFSELITAFLKQEKHNEPSSTSDQDYWRRSR